MTTLVDQMTDPLYLNWYKGALGLKYLTEGLESFVDDTLKSVQKGFLDDIRNNTPGLQDVKCTECTTANVLPCQTPGMCKIRKRGKISMCTYHDKTDTLKTSRPCPNYICDIISVKISHQHRYSTPSWKNTNAQNWCTNHDEIGKCFLPKSGYEGKTSTSETDSSGILHMAINCLSVQDRLDVKIDPQNDILSKLINVRNLIFHSASCTLAKEKLDSYIDDMVTLLEDKKTLLDSPNAKKAVLKLKQNDDFVISTKDELEIRFQALWAKYEKTEKALRKIKHKQKEAIGMIEHTQAKKRKLSDQNEDPSNSNNSQLDELRSSMQKIQSTNEDIKGRLKNHENKLKSTEATLTNVQKDYSDLKEAMQSTNDEIEYLKRNQKDFYDDDDDDDKDSDDENEDDLYDNEYLGDDDDDDDDSNKFNDFNEDNEDLDDNDDDDDDDDNKYIDSNDDNEDLDDGDDDDDDDDKSNDFNYDNEDLDDDDDDDDDDDKSNDFNYDNEDLDDDDDDNDDSNESSDDY